MWLCGVQVYGRASERERVQRVTEFDATVCVRWCLHVRVHMCLCVYTPCLDVDARSAAATGSSHNLYIYIPKCKYTILAEI